LESLAVGQIVNVISVDETTAHHSRLALERMLSLPQTAHSD
jgi:quinolinate synthase